MCGGAHGRAPAVAGFFSYPRRTPVAAMTAFYQYGARRKGLCADFNVYSGAVVVLVELFSDVPGSRDGRQTRSGLVARRECARLFRGGQALRVDYQSLGFLGVPKMAHCKPGRTCVFFRAQLPRASVRSDGTDAM